MIAEPVPWSDAVWRQFLDRVGDEEITPVLGAGASRFLLGSGAELAAQWAAEVDYPFGPIDSLPVMAQYAASIIESSAPARYVERYVGSRVDDFVVGSIGDVHNVYRFLPTQPFKVWITTNYDDLIERALLWRGIDPTMSVGRWTPPNYRWKPSDRYTFDTESSVGQPHVFHLHGLYDDRLSMVISTSDYLVFLEQMRQEEGILPGVVEDALTRTSLLFIGYSFNDTNLQLLLRQWNLPNKAFAVQPVPDHVDARDVEDYTALTKASLRDIAGLDVEPYWGTSDQFCADFASRVGEAAAR